MNYIIMIMAIIMALEGVGLKILKSENDKLLVNEGTYKTELKTLSDTIKSKDADIDASNKSIDVYKALSDKRALEAEGFRQAAVSAGKPNRELADQILAMQRPEGMSACDAATKVFNDYIDKRNANEQITTPTTPTPVK